MKSKKITIVKRDGYLYTNVNFAAETVSYINSLVYGVKTTIDHHKINMDDVTLLTISLSIYDEVLLDNTDPIDKTYTRIIRVLMGLGHSPLPAYSMLPKKLQITFDYIGKQAIDKHHPLRGIE
jgi:hypothetical protein